MEKWGKWLDFFRLRRRDYQFAFTSPSGQRVLHHLAKFCRANNSCFEDDPRRHARMEGRRDVWLLIERHLNLSSEQLLSVYSGGQFKPDGDDDGR